MRESTPHAPREGLLHAEREKYFNTACAAAQAGCGQGNC
jgi:hypothetical protein